MMQKKLAHNISKNLKAKKPLNKKELLISAGYDVVTATASSTRTIQQAGVLKELNVLGFDEESAKRVVSQIMLDEGNEPNDRLKASDQVFKVHGTYAPEKRISATVDINELQNQVTEQIKFFRQLKEGQQ